MTRTEGTRLVQHAWDRGIRFFDTAAAYGHGRSEEILGEALESQPDAQVCTKAAIDPRSSGFAMAVIEAIDAALRRLRRDQISIFLLHGPADDTPWSAVDLTVLEQVKRDGKIGAWGVSSRSIVGAQRVLDHRVGTWIEWVLNPLERRPETRIFPHLGSHGFIARSPLARGLLSRRHVRQPTAFTDIRSTLPKSWQNWTRTQATRLAELTGDDDLVGLSLRYAASQDAVDFVVPGLRSEQQIEEACAAVEQGPLTASTLAHIDSFPSCYPPWA